MKAPSEPKKRGRRRGYKKQPKVKVVRNPLRKGLRNSINDIQDEITIKQEDNNSVSQLYFVDVVDESVELNNKECDEASTDITDADIQTDPLGCIDDEILCIDQKASSDSPIINPPYDELIEKEYAKQSEICAIQLTKEYKNLRLCKTDKGFFYVTCPACAGIFTRVDHFHKHLFTHIHKLSNEKLMCNYCHHSEMFMDSMLLHLYNHSNQCEVCLIKLTKREFDRHWESIETVPIMKDINYAFKCPMCELYFHLNCKLRKHMLLHFCNKSRIYQCQDCGCIVSSAEQLSVHRCLSCPVCNKLFDSISKLKQHTGYQKHHLTCSTCSNIFILKQDYERHMELHKESFEPHEQFEFCYVSSKDEHCFMCQICGKIMYQLNLTLQHIITDHRITKICKTNSQLSSSLSKTTRAAATTNYVQHRNSTEISRVPSKVHQSSTITDVEQRPTEVPRMSSEPQQSPMVNGANHLTTEIPPTTSFKPCEISSRNDINDQHEIYRARVKYESTSMSNADPQINETSKCSSKSSQSVVFIINADHIKPDQINAISKYLCKPQESTESSYMNQLSAESFSHSMKQELIISDVDQSINELSSSSSKLHQSVLFNGVNKIEDLEFKMEFENDTLEDGELIIS